MLELQIIDFILILFFILGLMVRVSMMSHITVTKCHTSVTVTVTQSHVMIEHGKRF